MPYLQLTLDAFAVISISSYKRQIIEGLFLKALSSPEPFSSHMNIPKYGSADQQLLAAAHMFKWDRN